MDLLFLVLMLYISFIYVINFIKAYWIILEWYLYHSMSWHIFVYTFRNGAIVKCVDKVEIVRTNELIYYIHKLYARYEWSH